jgi:hypothetical protein
LNLLYLAPYIYAMAYCVSNLPITKNKQLTTKTKCSLLWSIVVEWLLMNIPARTPFIDHYLRYYLYSEIHHAILIASSLPQSPKTTPTARFRRGVRAILARDLGSRRSGAIFPSSSPACSGRTMDGGGSCKRSGSSL